MKVEVVPYSGNVISSHTSGGSLLTCMEWCTRVKTEKM